MENHGNIETVGYKMIRRKWSGNMMVKLVKGSDDKIKEVPALLSLSKEHNDLLEYYFNLINI